MGATTVEEYRSTLKTPPWAVPAGAHGEPSPEDSLTILKGLKKTYRSTTGFRRAGAELRGETCGEVHYRSISPG